MKAPRMRIQKRLLALYLASYLMLASVPLVTLAFFYYTDFSKSIDDSLIQDAQKNTVGTMNVLDSHLSIISSLPAQLYSNKAVLAYKNTGETLDRLEVINQLKQLVGGNELIEDLYLYFRSYGTFVSAYTNSYSLDQLRPYGPSSVLYYKGIDFESLCTLLSNQYESVILPTQSLKLGGQATQPILTFVDTLPQRNHRAYAAMLTFINVRELDKLVRSTDSLGYLLLDSRDALVLCSAGEGWDAEALSALMRSAPSGAQWLAHGGQKAIFSWSRSESTGWCFAQLFAASALAQSMLALRSKVLLITFGLMVILLLIILLLMRKTYKPISDLFTVASSIGSVEKGGSAFDLIEQTMNSLHQRNVRLLDELNDQKGYMMEHTAQLLLGTSEKNWNEQVFEEGRRNGLAMDLDVYQVLILHYEDPARMRAALPHVRECCGDLFVCSVIEIVYDQLLLILGGAAAEKELLARLDLSPLQADIIAAGSQVESPACWNRSYNAALTVSSYALLHRDERRLFTESDLPRDFYAFDNTPWILIIAFDSALTQGNVKNIRNLHEQCCEYILQKNTNYIEAKTIVCQLLTHLRGRLPEHSAAIDQEIRRVFMSRTNISAEELTRILETYIDLFCEQTEEKRLTEVNPLIERSLKFIDENLSSRDLSLAIVAEYIGLSPSRFSTLFSQQMDCNYKTYVDNLRIERARKLLEESNLMINEVAEAVGYVQTYSFTRLFKKKVGVSASEYRERCRSRRS